jgi:uncharacterized protein YndB with AHSA1/START domain
MTTKKKNPTASTADREIVMTRLFDAPRELVFKAWTDPKQIPQWWGPKGFTTTVREMTVKPGGLWRYIMHGPDGTDYNNRVVYNEVVSPERLDYIHGSDEEPNQFHVTVTFAEEDGKTRITSRMLFPSAEACEAVKKFGAIEGGNQTLDRLAAHLPQMEDFVITRVFDAPRELVWQAWTDPKHMSWWGPKGVTITIRKLEFRPGGLFHYCMHTPDGHDMWGKWVIREIVPPERLVFINSFSDEAGNFTHHPMSPTWPLQVLSILTLAEQGGKTLLTIRWRPEAATAEERKTFAAGHVSMQQGWSGTLDKLSEYLTKK